MPDLMKAFERGYAKFKGYGENDCPKCGTPIEIGVYPFCPHGKARLAAIPDDIPGGQWFENGLKEPQKFYSKSAHRKAVEANGCQITPYWVPNDKHLTRWDSVDLDAAKALVSRTGPSRESVSKETERLARCLAEHLNY